jgi:mRNA interferase MazF
VPVATEIAWRPVPIGDWHLRLRRQTIKPTDHQGVQVQRGEVWWARFDEQRPVVILSDSSDCGGDDESGMRAVQIVAAAGVDVGALGREVTIGTLTGLPSDAVVRVAFPRPGFVPCTWLTTLRADDLVEYIGTLAPARLAEIDEALSLGEHIVSAEDAGHDEATSILAAIRQSLRQGTMTTRQIKRV